MTSREKLIEMLVANGMFETQAEEVMDMAQERDDMGIHWNFSHDQYADMMYPILFESIKPIALEWIEKNKPQAWYKGCFV